jgi:cytidine deaminase
MPAPQILSTTNATHVEQTCAAHGLSASEFHTLRRQAAAAKALAHCPYSRFHVGAALLTRYGGVVVTGANIENASYPVGTCAERVAMGRAVMEGHRDFKAVAVATDTPAPCSPCGMCRQL